MSGWGASPEDWAHFDLMLGLTADLLPVVSNPHAEVSPDSKMRGLGKTPSIYNRTGKVAGLPKWTERQTTPAQIEKWSKENDYGICVQTRLVRGLDIDIGDPALSAWIAERFQDLVGRSALPTRGRADSGKRLLGFTLVGEFRKRSFKVEGGLVEFLATGQQFIIAGTHPGGARYAWAGGLPRDFPEIPAEDFERAWSALIAEFAIEPEHRSVRRGGSGEGPGDVEDDVAAHLEAHWPTFGTQGGKLLVECPWKQGHSMDSGDTEAVWLLAGTGGYAQGHFECLHASCAGRTDQEFLAAVGFKPATVDDFQDVVTADPVTAYLAAAASAPAPSTKVRATGAPHPMGAAMPLPGFARNSMGKVLATLANATAAVASPEACGARLRFDTFRGELVIASPGGEDWRAFEDADAVQLRIRLGRLPPMAEEFGKELVRDAITLVARDNRFDTAIEWLEAIVPAWDGVPRIEGFYPDYFKTDDTPYSRAVGLYVWTAHAGRVLDPGCQADMATILIGHQGLRKSTGVAAMSPDPTFCAEIDLGLKDADLSRQLRGLLVGELAELKGLAGREREAIRAWVTQKHERWTPKWREYGTIFSRRCIFHGTANDETPLGDDTGERRWLPLVVRSMVDVERIEADRLQLWAEGRERWKAQGILWEAAERLAHGEHHKFKAVDPWEGPVGRWLDTASTDGVTPRDAGVRGEDVLMFALGIEPARTQKRDEMRIGAVMRTCGMVRIQRREGRENLKIWVDAHQNFG